MLQGAIQGLVAGLIFFGAVCGFQYLRSKLGKKSEDQNGTSSPDDSKE